METDNKDIPAYSNDAYLAFQILLNQSNDLIIYIEDEKGIHLYETLLERLFFGSDIHLHVEAVSGKKNVIDVYEKSKNSKSSEHKIPCFFVVDFDLDVVVGRPIINDANFIYLERYSIENYLVDEEVGIKFVKGRTNENRKFCRNKINFNEWLNDISKQMKKLVTIYSTVQKLGLRVDNCSLTITRFTKDKARDVIDDKKVNDYLLKTVFRDYKRSKMYGLAKVYLMMDKKISHLYNEDLWRIIPGKQLLQLYLFYLQKYTDNKGVNKSDFENIACHSCDLSSLQFLKESILNYLDMRSKSQAV